MLVLNYTPYSCEQRRVESGRRHQMETLSALLSLCTGNSPVTGEFPSQEVGYNRIPQISSKYRSSHPVDNNRASTQWEQRNQRIVVMPNLSSLVLSDLQMTSQWCHNGHDGVSNHQPHRYLLNRLLACRSKKTSELRATGLCAGNSPVTGEYPHKGPVTWKTFPFDDVIMITRY